MPNYLLQCACCHTTVFGESCLLFVKYWKWACVLVVPERKLFISKFEKIATVGNSKKIERKIDILYITRKEFYKHLQQFSEKNHRRSKFSRRYFDLL